HALLDRCRRRTGVLTYHTQPGAPESLAPYTARTIVLADIDGLDADRQAGGLVVVDRHRDGGRPGTLNSDVNTASGSSSAPP
ncbi:MAG: hypothetical protein PV358_04610, partial [Acidimicrobiales bacterium]|nr:hypothetical protein [Acidimicrobiales bacterium]